MDRRFQNPRNSKRYLRLFQRVIQELDCFCPFDWEVPHTCLLRQKHLHCLPNLLPRRPCHELHDERMAIRRSELLTIWHHAYVQATCYNLKHLEMRTTSCCRSSFVDQLPHILWAVNDHHRPRSKLDLFSETIPHSNNCHSPSMLNSLRRFPHIASSNVTVC